ncbi:hypothetical protein B0H66DRAFT_286932 [Apodospora peruviana]|uniref:Uncharacterized protein n=1 Tax=Apodospora peruviana TaxID=516989 RepID=A0AAE0I0B3_9PEZI|nr:hypothetical protein B0H66DRAFT_286932 [Apodospora peruviana]
MARQVSRSDRGLSPSSQPPHSRQRHNNPSTYRPPGERFAPYPPATQRQAPYTPARFNNSMSPRSTHLFQQGGMRDLTSRSVPLRRPAPRSIRPARQVEWPRQYGPTTLQAWTANASPREDRAQRRLRQRLHQNQNSEMLLPVSIYDGSRGQFHAFQSLLCRGLQYIMLHPHALKQLSNMIPADLPGSPSRFCSLIGLVHLRRYIELVIEHLPSGVNARTWRVIVLDDDVPYVGIDIYLGQPYLETNFGGDLPRVSADDISGREMYLAPETTRDTPSYVSDSTGWNTGPGESSRVLLEDFSAITLQSSSWGKSELTSVCSSLPQQWTMSGPVANCTHPRVSRTVSLYRRPSHLPSLKARRSDPTLEAEGVAVDGPTQPYA